MKVVGLITEYNPFHNGHLYHIEQSKKLTGADYVVVVMSGNFVQRGTPAFTDKYTRTRMALACGADVVIELPVCYATGSAEFFAYGAVSLLDSLGFIDYICFGSECGSIKILSKIAELLIKEPEEFKQILTSSLKAGNSFPTARMHAVIKHFQEDRDDTIEKMLTSSNNILGIEYIKALKRLNSTIEPFTITRISNQYHDVELDKTGISSATSLRISYGQEQDLELLRPSIPQTVYDILKEKEKQSFPITENDCSDLLYYRLLQESEDSLTNYADISDPLSKRILNHLSSYTNFEEYAKLLKTRHYTLTRINRAFLHIILNINTYSSSTQPGYIRILGLKKNATHLIRSSSISPKVPIITKVADGKQILDESALAMLNQDIQGAHIYNRMVYSKFGTVISNEYQHGIILD